MLQVCGIGIGLIGMPELRIEGTTPVKCMIPGHRVIAAVLTALVGALIDGDQHVNLFL